MTKVITKDMKLPRRSLGIRSRGKECGGGKSPSPLFFLEYLFIFYRNMSVIENMQSLILSSDMSQWLENKRHEKGLYHMMYDQKSIAEFSNRYSLSPKQAKSAINDWYSQRGD